MSMYARMYWVTVNKTQITITWIIDTCIYNDDDDDHYYYDNNNKKKGHNADADDNDDGDNDNINS